MHATWTSRLLLSLGIAATIILPPRAPAASLRPHNELILPMDAPMDVEVRFDDTELRYEAIPAASSAISPVGGILATARYRKMEEDIIRPAMATLNASLSRTPRRDRLAEVIRNTLEATGKIRVGEVRVHDRNHPAPDATIEADRPVLLVFLRYGMEPMMGGLSVHLGARYGRRGEVIAGAAASETFQQRIHWRDPAPLGGFSDFAEDHAAHWATLGPQAVDARIDAGLRDAIDMLAYELQRKPRFGRIPGKQYPVGTGYAAKETEHGDRMWLRVRDGTLVSLPLSSLD
jgi:hypothetical protein